MHICFNLLFRIVKKQNQKQSKSSITLIQSFAQLPIHISLGNDPGNHLPGFTLHTNVSLYKYPFSQKGGLYLFTSIRSETVYIYIYVFRRINLEDQGFEQIVLGEREFYSFVCKTKRKGIDPRYMRY